MDFEVIDERQRSLDDGCVEDTSIIAAVIKDSRKHLKELHITANDVEKAFPSISHHAIVKAIQRKCFPGDFISFISNMYSRSKTFLEIGD